MCTRYLDDMTHLRKCLAMVGNPTSDRGNGMRTVDHVFMLLKEAGRARNFDVINLTAAGYAQSLREARKREAEYDYLVVVGGDGMVALGANALGESGKPLGVVAIGSGNDFARGLGLPIDRARIAVEGIVNAITNDLHVDIDMGAVRHEATDGSQALHYFVGMLSCGLDASINERANRSKLPNGPLRYFFAVLMELTRMKSYGYHIRAVLADGSVEERDVVSPLLTVANSRHVGGGIELSPYSRFSDGQLDLIWLKRMPNLWQIIHAISNIYNGKLLDLHILGWQRISSIEISHSAAASPPPMLMADGEMVGTVPVKVSAMGMSLRVLVPTAVVQSEASRTEELVRGLQLRDGRR